jgi:hypothetical protein
LAFKFSVPVILSRSTSIKPLPVVVSNHALLRKGVAMFNFPLWICFPHQISIPTSSGEILGEPPSEYLVWIDEKDYIIAVYIIPSRMFHPMQGTEGFIEVFVLFTAVFLVLFIFHFREI